MIAVFDIDGVLADATHREHHVAAKPKNWDAFFAAVGDDAVIEAGRSRLLSESANHEVVLLSGRPESTRHETERWLESNGMGGLRLILRPDTDRRPAAVLKAQLIRELGTPEDILVVLDDDAKVVERLQGLGYPAELFVEPLR